MMQHERLEHEIQSVLHDMAPHMTHAVHMALHDMAQHKVLHDMAQHKALHDVLTEQMQHKMRVKRMVHDDHSREKQFDVLVLMVRLIQLCLVQLVSHLLWPIRWPKRK